MRIFTKPATVSLIVALTMLFTISPHSVMAADDHPEWPNATSISVPSTTSGIIDPQGDRDWFKFPVQGSSNYRARVVPGSLSEGYVRVYRQNGAEIGSSRSGDFSWTAPTNEDNYVEVWGGGSTRTGSYQLELTSSGGGSSGQPLQLVESGSSISPTSVVSGTGGRLTVTYKIYNPNSSSVTTGLGFSIAPSGSSSWIDDPSHDKTVSVSSGYSFFTRYFDVLSSASAGTYTAWYAIKDGGMTGPNFDDFQRNDLTVTPKESRQTYIELPYVSGYKYENIYLRARLLEKDTNLPIAGAKIRFLVSGVSTQVVETDKNGWASTPFIHAGYEEKYRIDAYFDGNEYYYSSQANAVVSVRGTYSGEFNNEHGKVVPTILYFNDREAPILVYVKNTGDETTNFRVKAKLQHLDSDSNSFFELYKDQITKRGIKPDEEIEYVFHISTPNQKASVVSLWYLEVETQDGWKQFDSFELILSTTSERIDVDFDIQKLRESIIDLSLDEQQLEYLNRQPLTIDECRKWIDIYRRFEIANQQYNSATVTLVPWFENFAERKTLLSEKASIVDDRIYEYSIRYKTDWDRLWSRLGQKLTIENLSVKVANGLVSFIPTSLR